MAQPDKIMLIRHGEKEAASEPDVLGVTEEGTDDRHSLTVRGWERAGALVSYFEHPRHPEIKTPTTIFAADRDDSQDVAPQVGKSRRPIETVTPLRERLGNRTAWSTRAVGDVDGLIGELKACEGVVLVCWEHKRIPLIAAGFIQDPPVWDNRFDLVWVLDRNGDRYTLTQLNQDLLAGDAPT
jgi:broad specificity phosphatase PhoE